MDSSICLSNSVGFVRSTGEECGTLAHFPGAGAQNLALRHISATDKPEVCRPCWGTGTSLSPSSSLSSSQLCNSSNALGAVYYWQGTRSFPGSTFWHVEKGKKPPSKILLPPPPLKFDFICHVCISRTHTLSKWVTPPRKGTNIMNHQGSREVCTCRLP